MLVGVNSNRSKYIDLVTSILDKFLITGLNGFAYVVYALNTIVLKKQDNIILRQPIPENISKRANEVRELIDEKDLWVPMDPTKNDDPEYLKIHAQDQEDFVHLVEEVVTKRVRTLIAMPIEERRRLIQDDQKRNNEQQILKRENPLDKKRINNFVNNVDSPDAVLEYAQWRLNLMAPWEGKGLTQDQMTTLANLLDRNKFPWEEAQLLTANLPLAHWLSSPQISNLILNDILNKDDPYDFRLMTSPTSSQMDKITLLHGFLQKKILSLYQVIKINDEDFDYELLENPAFQERLLSSSLSNEDINAIDDMGIPIQNLQKNQKNKRRIKIS